VKAKYASADGLSSSGLGVGGAGCNFTLEEVEAIRAELYNIQQSLSTGEQEKVELMKNLACLKDDLTRLQASGNGQHGGQRNSDSALDVSGSNPSFSTAASQTDLSGEVIICICKRNLRKSQWGKQACAGRVTKLGKVSGKQMGFS
jgi:hypothetical protein